MNPSSLNLGRYTRLALLLLMLASQGMAVAHDIGDSHALQSDPCTSCVIGHGLGTAVGASYEAPPLPVCQPLAAVYSNVTTLTSRTGGHFARAPPTFSRNTYNPN